MEIMLTLIVLGIISLVLILIRSSIERKQFELCEYNITSDKIYENITFVMLADLHSKEYGYQNRKLIKKIKQCDPSAILIAGDMFVGNRTDDCQVALQLLNDLSQIAPIYYGLGNHEDRIKEYIDETGQSKYQWYMRQLNHPDIHVLDNESIVIHDNIRITGLTVEQKYFEKFNHKIMSVREVSKKIGNSSKDKYEILLAHNPVHLESYMKWGADLTVSGHLHGGIVRLPILGGLITPQVKVLPRFSAGKYEKDNKVGIVSRGLGEHTVSLRFLNLPELSVIHLKSSRYLSK